MSSSSLAPHPAAPTPLNAALAHARDGAELLVLRLRGLQTGLAKRVRGTSPRSRLALAILEALEPCLQNAEKLRAGLQRSEELVR